MKLTKDLGMSNEALAAVGRSVLGIVNNPNAPGFSRPMPTGVEPGPARTLPPGTRILSSTDGELLATTAAVMAAKAKVATVEEPEPEQKPETEAQALARLSRENEQKLAQIKRDLAAYARKHGVDLNKPTAKDPEIEAAQRKADERKRLLDDAVKATETKRAAKARKRAAKLLRRLGV